MRGNGQGERRGGRSGANSGRGASPAARGRGRGGAGSPAAGSSAAYNAVPPPAALAMPGGSARAGGGRGAGSGHRGLGYSGGSGASYGSSAPYGGGSFGSGSGAYGGGAYGSSPYGSGGSPYGGGRGSTYGNSVYSAQGSYGGGISPGAGRQGFSSHAQADEAYLQPGRPHFCIAEEDTDLLAVRLDPKVASIFELCVAPGERFSNRWLAAVSRWAANVARKHPNFPRELREAAAAAAAAAAASVTGQGSVDAAAGGMSGSAEAEEKGSVASVGGMLEEMVAQEEHPVQHAVHDGKSDAGSSSGSHPDDALDMVTFLQQQRQQAAAKPDESDEPPATSATANPAAAATASATSPRSAAATAAKPSAAENTDSIQATTTPAATTAAGGPEQALVAEPVPEDAVSALLPLLLVPPAGPLVTAPDSESGALQPPEQALAGHDAAEAATQPADAASAAPVMRAEKQCGVLDEGQPQHGDLKETGQQQVQHATEDSAQQDEPATEAAATVQQPGQDEQQRQAEEAGRAQAAEAEAADDADDELPEAQIVLPVTDVGLFLRRQQMQQEGGSDKEQATVAAEAQDGGQAGAAADIRSTKGELQSAAAADASKASDIAADEGAVEGAIQGDGSNAAPDAPHSSAHGDSPSRSATSGSVHRAGSATAATERQAAGSVSAAAAAAAAAAAEARLAAVAALGRDRGDGKQHDWRCRVSLRLERQGITDEEMRQLADWHATISPALDVCKLWLYDNRIGDAGAAAAARIVADAPTLAELHLSHNQIGTAGAKALLGAVAPVGRLPPLKALWLRLEYNELDADALRRFAQEDCALRGLLIDIASEVPADRRHCHEKNMKWTMKHGVAHVQLPWLSCQRQAPSEAKVLQEARQAWARTAAAERTGAAAPKAAPAGAGGGPGGVAGQAVLGLVGLPPPPVPAAGAAAAATGARAGAAGGGEAAAGEAGAGEAAAGAVPQEGGNGADSDMVSKLRAFVGGKGGKRQLTPPPPPPPRGCSRSTTPGGAAGAVPFGASSSAASDAGLGSLAEEGQGDVEYVPGPLLLFPDTSAVLSMLGANGLQGRTVLSMGVLQSLAENGRFGRGLAPEHQTFIVLSDAVVKQLDSLKHEEGTGRLVRRLMGEGLDQLGPKGLDILTVLGAHEGEGLLLDRNANVAGSRSTSSSGQRSDISIVEVALFFKAELCAAAAAGAAGSSDGAGAEAGAGEAGAGRQMLPVVLLTNDNGQLQVAKAHGLPALRITGNPELDAALKAHLKQGIDLTSGDLRRIMGPAAVAGLGATAGRSVQDEFDGAVACLRGLLDAYQDITGLVQSFDTTLSSNQAPDEIVAALRKLLTSHSHATPFSPAPAAALQSEADCTTHEPTSPGAPTAAEETVKAVPSSPGVAGGNASVLEGSQATIAALQERLKGWEQVVRSRQAPSRVAKWSNGV